MEDTQDLSACVTKLQKNVLQWEHRLQSEPGEPDAFRQAVGELRAALDHIGRVGFQRLVHACEVAGDILEDDGRRYRFKQVADKVWMTLWGKVVVSRRLYQEDHGGPSRVPLDERCGMSGRFMVPELERMTGIIYLTKQTFFRIFKAGGIEIWQRVQDEITATALPCWIYSIAFLTTQRRRPGSSMPAGGQLDCVVLDAAAWIAATA